MPKSKKIDIDKSNTNSLYVEKDNPRKIYKRLNDELDQICSTHKIHSNAEKMKKSIVIAKSDMAKLFNYINEQTGSIEDEEIDALMNSEEYMKSLSDSQRKTAKNTYTVHVNSSQKHIADAYNIFSDNNKPLSKHEAYRKMKGISSSCDFVMKCIDNSRRIHVDGFMLAEHIRAYLYAMIYPPVFEVCTFNSSDVMYSKYPMFIELWCNMLESAIILDGICNSLHQSAIKLFYTRNDTLIYRDNECLFNTTNTSKNNITNYKHHLLELYKPSIKFACAVDAKRKNSCNKEFCKAVTTMIDYKFIQSGNRGISMNNNIASSIDRLIDTYVYQEPTEFVKCKSRNFLKLYPQYNLQKQLHLFDFIWHFEFPTVDFHLTNGFITNYVLYEIIRSNEKVLSKIKTIHKNEELTYSKSYTCDDAMELSIKNSIERYDLDFINSLIIRCSKTLRKYDFGFEKDTANQLWYSISNVLEHKLIDCFVKYLDILYNDNFTDNMLKIWDNSNEYYSKIYQDMNGI